MGTFYELFRCICKYFMLQAYTKRNSYFKYKKTSSFKQIFICSCYTSVYARSQRMQV